MDLHLGCPDLYWGRLGRPDSILVGLDLYFGRLDLYFGCLDFYLGCMDFYWGVRTGILGDWTCILDALYLQDFCILVGCLYTVYL